jgi:hypothetical protein
VPNWIRQDICHFLKAFSGFSARPPLLSPPNSLRLICASNVAFFVIFFSLNEGLGFLDFFGFDEELSFWDFFGFDEELGLLELFWVLMKLGLLEFFFGFRWTPFFAVFCLDE